MGTTYPCSDHYLPYPKIFNIDSYFAVIVSTKQNYVFRKKFWPCVANWRVMGLKKPENPFLMQILDNTPDSKVHWANMGPTWVLSAPGGPHVGPMNLAIRDRAAVDGRNAKINSGQETQPKRLNARYEMNCTHSFFLFIPPPNKVGGGVYWIHLVCPSVRPSVCL